MIMTDEQPLRRFWDAVCYGTFTGPHKRPSHKPHWKPYWVWNATGDAVICVFALLEPHLGDRRKARFYELWDERRAYERTRGHGQLALFPRFRLFERMGQVVAYLERVEAYRATGGLTEA